MRNFRIVIQYEGTRYQGWQKQSATANTLQVKFETLLSKLAGAPTEIAASGRTDAGVHAFGQTANFHMETKRTPQELMEEMNRYLPEDVAVISCAEVSERFHSRLNAKGKVYRYRVLNSGIPNVFERKYTYQVPEELDLEAMRSAAAFLEGTHDFCAFTSAKKSRKSTVRTISKIDIFRAGAEIHFLFDGDGFLYHMVRIMMGTLLETGMGRRTPDSVRELLDSGSRALAGPLVPARGLALMEVRY